MTEDNEMRETRLGLTQAVRDTLGRAKLSMAYKNLKACDKIPESAKVKPAPASDVALIAAAYKYLEKTEDNESREMRLDLKQEIRDMLGRGILYATNQEDVSTEVQRDPPSDVALIAAAYQFLQESGQLPLEQPDVVVCVHSSDEVHDFFERHGLSACADKLCEHLGIDSAEDLKLITVEDLQGSKFSAWAHGSLTLVQYKKVLKAFS